MFETNELHLYRDPFVLNPDGDRSSIDRKGQADAVLPYYSKDLKSWTAPFFMAPVNTRVVRRSHALFSEWGQGYGSDFTYQEYVKVGGLLSWPLAMGISAGLGLFTSLCKVPAGRTVLKKISPKPGTGPSEKTLDSGFFRLILIGTAENGIKVRATLKDSGDPGNRVTVKIICEAALSLALQRDSLPGGNERGGILTPATGLGLVLAERLKRAGMEITVQ